MNTPEHRTSTTNQFDQVLSIIYQLAQKSAGGDYIYRGEPSCYDKVSSNLYRRWQKLGPDQSDFDAVQKTILYEAKKYTSETDEFEILSQLQHYGGETNLVDFTTDFLIALFFACDGIPDQDGRIVLLDTTGEMAPYIGKPHNPVNRTMAQKSLLVQPPMGFIEPDDTVVILHEQKQSVLDYLRICHGISLGTIYNDLHGFIKVQHLHNRYFEKLHSGLTHYAKGDYEQAIKDNSEAINLAPHIPAAYNNRGVAFSSLGRLDLAMADFNKALALDPNHADAYSNRGIAYNKMGYLDLAIQDYNKALELDSRSANTYNSRGNAYSDKSDWDIAIQDYSKALDLDPNNATIYNNRGTVLWSKGEDAFAIRDFDSALALNPEYADPLYNRALAYASKGALDLAIQDYSRALELHPDKSGFANRGITWLHLLEWEKAKHDLVTAKNMGTDIAVAFRAWYESVEDFEQKNTIKLPEDIRSIIGTEEPQPSSSGTSSVLGIFRKVGESDPEVNSNDTPSDGAKNYKHYLYGHPKE